MAQMALLRAQKEKAELEIATLEKLAESVKPMIHKCFEKEVTVLTTALKGKVREQIMADVRTDLDECLTKFKDDITGTGTNSMQQFRDIMKEELSNALSLGANIGGSGGSQAANPSMSQTRSLKKRGSRRLDDDGPENQGQKAVRDMMRNVNIDEILTQANDIEVPVYNLLKNMVKGDGDVADTMTDTDGDSNPKSNCSKKILTDEKCTLLMCTTVLVNACIIGLKTDFKARNPGESFPRWVHALDQCTLVIFLCEILIRLNVDGIRMFFNSESPFFRWNIFDLVTTILQCLDEASRYHTDNYGVAKYLHALQTFRLIRVFRIFRLLRKFNCINFFSLESSLRLLLNALYEACQPFASIIIVLLGVLFLFGVTITNIVVESDMADQVEHFNNLHNSMISLYMVCTKGVLWEDLSKELASVSPVLPYILYLIVAFDVFVLCNTLVGIIVASAAQTMGELQEEMVCQRINELFIREQQADFTLDEFRVVAETQEMKSLLKVLSIDLTELPILFTLLDDDGNGRLDYFEFMSGALRLRGPATMLELAMYIKEQSSVNEFYTKKLDLLERKTTFICLKMQESAPMATGEDCSFSRQITQVREEHVPSTAYNLDSGVLVEGEADAREDAEPIRKDL